MFFCVFIDFRAFRLVLQPAGRFKDCRCQGFHQIPATWFTRRPVLMFWLICAFTCGILICMRIAIIDRIFLHICFHVNITSGFICTARNYENVLLKKTKTNKHLSIKGTNILRGFVWSQFVLYSKPHCRCKLNEDLRLTKWLISSCLLVLPKEGTPETKVQLHSNEVLEVSVSLKAVPLEMFSTGNICKIFWKAAVMK